MTHKKLLEEIITQYQNNEAFISKENEQLLTQIKQQHQMLAEQADAKMDSLHQEMVTELTNAVSANNKADIEELNQQYTAKLNETKKELQEIVTQSQNNNETFISKGNEQLLTRIKQQHQMLAEQADVKMDSLHQEMVTELTNAVSANNKADIEELNKQYITKLNETKEELEKIVTQSQNNNETFISKGNEQLLARIKQQHQMLAEQADNKIESLHQKMATELNETKKELEERIDSYYYQMMSINQYKLIEAKKEIEAKIDSNFYKMLSTNQRLSEEITSLQKDISIIMETLQLILTNMLLDEVEEK